MSVPNQPEREQPQRILSDQKLFDIVNPKVGYRYLLRILPDGQAVITSEPLIQSVKDRLVAEDTFGTNTRLLIMAGIEQQAAKLVPDTNLEAAEMEIADRERPFRESLADLADNYRFGQGKLKKMVTNEGRQFTSGETQMGFMPSVVRGEVTRLHGIVDGYFEAKNQEMQGRK